MGTDLKNAITRDANSYSCQLEDCNRKKLYCRAPCTKCEKQVCRYPYGNGPNPKNYCDGLIHMGCKQELLDATKPNGGYANKMTPIELCRTCRTERTKDPVSFKKAEGAQHFYFFEYRYGKKVGDKFEEKAPERRDGRRLTNQALIDRLIRESTRCQES